MWGSMVNAVMVHDETMSGNKTKVLSLEFSTNLTTIEEIIKKRIYQEVTEYNALSSNEFNGLVQPTKAEKLLNGVKQKEKKIIDWEKQYKIAVEAFNNNGFIIIINNKQAESLGQIIELKLETEISFLKIVPLVGG
jgi:hypothetical protein